MTVESAADQLAMLADYGVTATINGTITVTGIFDDKFLMVDDLSLNIESSEPQLLCRSSDLTGVTNGGTLVVNSTNYVITTLEPDGTGLTVITLHLAT